MSDIALMTAAQHPLNHRLVALIRAGAAIGGRFSVADLAVAVWRRDPEGWSLDGYQHPDVRRVWCCLYGRPRYSLIGLGAVVRVVIKGAKRATPVYELVEWHPAVREVLGVKEILEIR